MTTMFQTLHRVMNPTDHLKIECGACRRRVEFSQAEAFALFGPDAAPFDVKRRAVCSACGARERAAVWI